MKIYQQTRFHKQLLPIKSYPCPLCGRSYTFTGFSRHFKACCSHQGFTTGSVINELSPSVYGDEWAYAVKCYELLSFRQDCFRILDASGYRFVNISRRKPWHFVDGHLRDECQPFFHVEHDGSVNYRRSWKQFRKHLYGELCLSLVPKDANRFLCIDLDGPGQVQGLPEIEERLVSLGLSYHLEYSGNKGMHVWLFWDSDVSRASIQRLHGMLTEDLDVDRSIYPFSDVGIKLPLGTHPKTGHLCTFLDGFQKTFELDEQIPYFLEIKPMSTSRILRAIGDYLPSPSVSVPSSFLVIVDPPVGSSCASVSSPFSADLSEAHLSVIDKRIDGLLSSHKGTELQRSQAKDTLSRLVGYLVAHILRNGGGEGEGHVSFRKIAERTGINRKRLSKWMPHLGELFRWKGESWSKGLSRNYSLSYGFSKALGVKPKQTPAPRMDFRLECRKRALRRARKASRRANRIYKALRTRRNPNVLGGLGLDKAELIV